MSDVDTAAIIIKRALEQWSEPRAAVRAAAITEARELIESKLGKLEHGDVERLFKLFHADHRDGKLTHDRFSRAFAGSLAHKLLGHLPALNRWTERIWRATTDDDVAKVLDEFWGTSKLELPGAGSSFPTVLLHVREPERYWPLTASGVGVGYRRLTGKSAHGRKAERYLEYVRWIRALRERYYLPAHAVDLVLSIAAREDEAGDVAEHGGAVGLELVETFTHDGPVQVLSWSPNGFLLASASKGGKLSLWDVVNSTLANDLRPPLGVHAMAWSPSGLEIATCSDDEVIRIWDTKTGVGAPLDVTLDVSAPWTSLAWSPDGRLAAGNADGRVLVAAVQQGSAPKILRNRNNKREAVTAVTWSRKGRWLATGSFNNSFIQLWDGHTLKPLRQFAPFHARPVLTQSGMSSLAWSPVDERLAIAGNGECVVQQMEFFRETIEPTGSVSSPSGVISAAWSPDGRRLALGSLDGRIRVWDPIEDREVACAQVDNIVNVVAWSSDNTLLATGSSDNLVRVWRFHDGSPSQSELIGLGPSIEIGEPDVASTPAPRDFTFALDLRLAGQRTCNVRLTGTSTWPDDGALLPLLSELDHYSRDANREELDAFGRQLFASLFTDSILAEYRAARKDAEAAGTPLRIVLCVHPDADNPERCSITEYFWETLVDPERGPIAIDQHLRLIRTRPKFDRLSTPAPTPVLRIDVGFADPIDRERLDLYQEFANFHRLQHAASSSEVLDVQFHPTLALETLRARIHDTDIFHFAGHGEPGGLVLEGPNRASQPLAGDALRALLTTPLPRLVVLNACFGSVGSGWISVAEAFLERGVAAVVAMNGALADRTALLFADELHKRLAAGDDVEHAVQQARWRAFAEQAPTWFVPVLWTRTAQTFALVDPEAAQDDEAVREAVEALDRRAESLRPRVMILERLADRRIDADARSELADTLLAQVADAPDRDAEIDRLLDNDAEIERQLARIRGRTTDPSAELREVATTLRRDLVPQLGAAANSLPGLVDALRTMLTHAAPAAVDASAVSPSELDYPFAESEPLVSGATLDELVTRAKSHLVLDDELVRRCLLHLLAGRHLVLAGPPGTGKSTLAKGLARAFDFEPRLVTANPDWTTFDTIGGLAPVSVRDADGRSHVSYPFKPGCVLEAVDANWIADNGRWRRHDPAAQKRGTWLVIDEMNRAPLDQAFGDLFTALVDRELRDPRRTLPLPIPRDFRLICTTNTSDRRLLFEFSEALKRRFAFVEIPAFRGTDRGLQDRSKLREQLRERDGVRDQDIGPDFEAVLEAVERIVERVRVLHPLGLAQVLDILTFVAVGRRYQPQADLMLLSAALIDNLLPALEAQPAALLEALAALLDGKLDVWVQNFIETTRGGYRPDPVRMRIAAELLRHLANHEVPRSVDLDWATQFQGHEQALQGTALPSAAEFVQALRRLAAERDG